MSVRRVRAAGKHTGLGRTALVLGGLALAALPGGWSPELTAQALTAQALTAQARWSDPSVINVGREPPHVSFVPFADPVSALEGRDSLSPWWVSLDGSWRFARAGPTNR